MNRAELVQILRDLQSDEFDPKQVMYLNKKELTSAIIECAYYYREEYNNKNK